MPVMPMSCQQSAWAFSQVDLHRRAETDSLTLEAIGRLDASFDRRLRFTAFCRALLYAAWYFDISSASPTVLTSTLTLSGFCSAELSSRRNDSNVWCGIFAMCAASLLASSARSLASTDCIWDTNMKTRRRSVHKGLAEQISQPTVAPVARSFDSTGSRAESGLPPPLAYLVWIGKHPTLRCWSRYIIKLAPQQKEATCDNRSCCYGTGGPQCSRGY